MMTMRVLMMVGFVGLFLGSGGPGPAWAGYPIAGTQPSERPVGAPVTREVKKPDGWYERALTGISQPYPRSLKFLEDQGNWYTPFNRPGMRDRYNIRGWLVR